ncbi:MAG TPA: succinate dehydrogenase, hydrophobic membrane anchor protein [Burkholderiales bacterium]|jgi:succinate dehydrogenase / fumarate reductase membrane anchor subunit|nr:succinate dehydrogenase, hydrophobic membrane anchor protein [Burkholderiales bacterium]
MVNREVIGAHYGLGGWLAQRVTAIVMALYTLLFLILMVRAPQLDFSGWRMLFAPQWMKLATLLFLAGLYLHAWIGVRNIFMDYIKSNSLRLVLHVSAIVWLLVCAGWSVQILWSV